MASGVPYRAQWLDLDDPEATSRWRSFCYRAAFTTPYSSIPFARAIKQGFGFDFKIAVVLDEEEEIRAGVLIYLSRRGPYSQTVTPSLVQYTPVLLNPIPSEADLHVQISSLDALLYFLEHSFSGIRLSLHPEMMDVRPFIWRRWTASPAYTYCIDLSAGAHETKNWSSGTRRLFRSEIENYRVQEAQSKFDTVVGLARESYDRQEKAFAYSPGQTRAAIRLLLESGLIRVFSAFNTVLSKTDGGLILLCDGDTAYYWLAGSVPGPAMTIIIGTVLTQLHDEGYRTFDFVGANTPSIAEFKRRFGPELRPYFRVTRFTRQELKLLNALRNPR